MIRHGHLGVNIRSELDSKVARAGFDGAIDARCCAVGLGEEAVVELIVWAP